MYAYYYIFFPIAYLKINYTCGTDSLIQQILYYIILFN